MRGDAHTRQGTRRPARGAGAVRGALVVALLGVAAVACGTPSSDGSSGTIPPAGNAGVVESTETPQLGGTLTYGLGSETNGWNPGSSQWAPSGEEVAKTFFDTLSAYDEEARIQPNLAAKFEHNDTYTQWVITMRPGVTLHNGKPVDGKLVKANQEYLKSSELTKRPYDPIDNFALNDDPLAVVVNMKEPWVNYPYALATQIGVVVDQDWLVSKNVDKPIGTGPFSLESWTPEKELVVKKNPAYWRKDERGVQLPYLDKIVFRPITDDTSRTASLQKGDIDVMQTSNAQDIISFKEKGAKGEFQVFNAISGETSESMAMLNTQAAPFDDLDARMALAYATDKQNFIDTVAQGLYQPANGPFAPTSRWYNKAVETAYPQFDQTKARELVDKVKAKHGGQFTFKLIGPPGTSVGQSLAVLQGQWKEVGIDVQVDQIEQAQLIVQVLTGQYQATVWQQFASPHPLGDSIWWHPQASAKIPDFALNFARNEDPAIGAALDDGRHTTDPAKELADYQAVQERLAKDVPYVWLFHSQISVVARNNIINVVNYKLPPNDKGEQKKGLELQNGSHPLYATWIKPT